MVSKTRYFVLKSSTSYMCPRAHKVLLKKTKFTNSIK